MHRCIRFAWSTAHTHRTPIAFIQCNSAGWLRPTYSRLMHCTLKKQSECFKNVQKRGRTDLFAGEPKHRMGRCARNGVSKPPFGWTYVRSVEIQFVRMHWYDVLDHVVRPIFSSCAWINWPLRAACVCGEVDVLTWIWFHKWNLLPIKTRSLCQFAGMTLSVLQHWRFEHECAPKREYCGCTWTWLIKDDCDFAITLMRGN